ncbi:hypothetical protein LL974_00870 [Xanthomonas campestris pv. cannae]|nr:hypothetical protein [Xanthomonas campestris pv. cannae]
MSNQLMVHYDFVTPELYQYVQECVDRAADTTHGYLKKEAALRADGAIRLWIALFVGASASPSLAPAESQRIQDDLVRLRKMVQDIPLDDQP